MTSKAEMLTELKKLLHDVFAARATGTAHPRSSRANGYVDGYMRALLEGGIATKAELLAIVAEERRVVFGDATRFVDSDHVAA
ncbi:MAG: hypothetical protein EXR75_15555 [Myxococcales bacterium]|nr:hypothetical protein [Myxococcales bacterium]